ncbi:MAG: hypothetical protein US68_C0006G0018 [Candidatus Shapirobacteria bacterium GW2011_GWE1_38_10]|uniref:Uncharacterized protein n=1 Tax=Candidatus Shapirobacteria bacterium GW2011_GWE1_38_10 TaxID=1618488 RepID=A0A0G0I4T5_9BACT|nr:MAG: hypothetical protein US68_C0006G0018 [Candidatus Shapirobacteria bacterium GW2011_GWE1_38_10]KKQ65161.1 MAG: hypothetical protein US85_C0001G0088 [Candidatus Shapirobacteria bacterium GW2011_GWF1_38_23]
MMVILIQFLLPMLVVTLTILSAESGKLIVLKQWCQSAGRERRNRVYILTVFSAKMTKKAFTLIETLVAVGVLAVLMVTVGAILLMSLKSKNSTEVNESMSSIAVFTLGELKKNIFDAQLGQINCPVDIGNSISFMTKSGGVTTLLCDEASGEVASVSASGNNYFLNEKVRIQNCNDFVWCTLSADSEILSIGFSLNLVTGGDGVGNSGIFHGAVTPRD